jgi:hypothetical protein
MVHTIRRLGRSEYIDYGGQGLIMDKDQFINLIEKTRKTYTYSSYKEGLVMEEQIPDVYDVKSYMEKNIPDGYVVKLFECSYSWSDEIKELIETGEDLGLKYIDSGNIGGKLECFSGDHVMCTYGNLFLNFTIYMQRFYVIFMKRLEPVKRDTSTETPENKGLFNCNNIIPSPTINRILSCKWYFVYSQDIL